jgi:hypothetical protein
MKDRVIDATGTIFNINVTLLVKCRGQKSAKNGNNDD